MLKTPASSVATCLERDGASNGVGGAVAGLESE